ncbi:MAG: hypothetical protein L0H31_08430 [Nocardioidaceae bacterium]|nr:hypothetical protein [Nocardioidaceae bacterium]
MRELLGRGAAIALLVLTLAACSDSDDAQSAPANEVSESATSATSPAPTSSASSPAPTPTIPAGAPRCRAVWNAGATLPGNYRGCVEGKGKARAYVKAKRISCSSGQGLMIYADKFWAVRGGTISKAAKLARSDAYLASIARCRG